MASSLPPNGLSSTNAIRAHSQANDIVQNDASRGNVAVHSFDPDASPAEKAAAAGKAGKQLTSTLPAKPTEGGRGKPLRFMCFLHDAELVLFLCKSWPLILAAMAPSLPSQSMTQTRKCPRKGPRMPPMPLPSRVNYLPPRHLSFPIGTKSVGVPLQTWTSLRKKMIRDSFDL